MLEKNLTYYCLKFEKLRRYFKNGGAPHKPILLISLIQAFQQGLYKSKEIFILPELVGLFKSNWNLLVDTNHHCLFTLPFYHLSTEPFWQLKPNAGCELWVKSKSSMRSFANLTTAVKYAIIDAELTSLMLKKEESSILIQFLLEKYFPNTKSNFSQGGNKYILDIEKQIVEESQESYKTRLELIRDEIDNDAFQEEVFVRSGIFKREVPRIYNFTCCISGLRVDALDNISMIDACHIVPFSESYNDTISNGIALCPNLHRAFDRGLISIDNNYKVILNGNFSENFDSTYNIKQFEGKVILLPENPNYKPSLESLKSHRERFGFSSLRKI
ncbi:MAG: HNH endonuclease [Bacteroidales bacterium]|nr:HNH endonuclease [Bacteroidales bacterium]MCF8455000.1 HNH endonuclease [Bacteroidales bacterium]